MPKKKAASLESTKALTRANRERCAQLVTLVSRKMEDIKDAFFEIGTALAEINNNLLYRAAGHDTFAALLEAEGFMSSTQANKLIAVAERLEREDAVVLGPEKAYAFTRYAKALGRGEPLSSLVQQRDLVNGHSVLETSVRQLLAATREAETQSRKTKPLTQARLAAARAARDAQAALRKLGWQEVAVTVAGRPGHDVFCLRVPGAVLRKMARLRPA